MVVSAWTLQQNFQLPDKNFYNLYYICIYIYIYLYIFAVFKNSYVFIPLFLSEPLKLFCENLRFRGNLFEKHWYNITVLAVKL